MKNTSLKRKVVIGCVLFTVILTLAIGASGYYQYYKNMTQKYHEYSGTIVKICESIFEKHHMAELIQNETMDESYDAVREELNTIKENSNIAYLFGVYFEDISDIDSLCFAINGARQEELTAAESETDVYSYMGELCSDADFDENMRQTFRQSILEEDRELNYYLNITKEYGYMLSCFTVIYNEAEEPVGILSVDIDMNDIRDNMKSYVIGMVVIAFVLMVILLWIFLFYINRYVTKPINRVAGSTAAFVKSLEQNVSPEELDYHKVEVRSKDEVGRLAEDVALLAESVKAYMNNLKGITAEKERISAELDVATNIQLSMLPCIFPAFPERTEFDIYAKLAVAQEMGGSFYDFFLVDQTHLAVIVGEIQGRGVPAALLMMITKTLIKNYAQLGYLPAQVFTETNNQLSDSNEGMTTTAFLGIVDLVSGDFDYVNAGHSVPLLKRAGGDFEWLPAKDCFVLGGMERVPYWQQSVKLAQGDLLFLYTKGLVKAQNREQREYGSEHMRLRLNQVMKEAYALQEIAEIMETDVKNFQADVPREQDIVMMLLRFF